MCNHFLLNKSVGFLLEKVLVKDQRNLSLVLELLSKWILATTTSLEADNKSIWPQIGIDFAQAMIDVLVQENLNKDQRGLNSVRITLLIQAHKNRQVTFKITAYILHI